MREIKSGLVNAEEQHDIVVLQNIPQSKALVKANRVLLLLVSTLMVIIFIMGFYLVPTDNRLDNFKAIEKDKIAKNYSVDNPVLSAEINALKSQFVGLISGSIESKLRMLEDSIRTGSTQASLGAVQDLRNDVKVLQSYSVPAEKMVSKSQDNEDILREVSQLKGLIYLTLTSCGLMVAAICGFWFRKRYRLEHPSSVKYRPGLPKQNK